MQFGCFFLDSQTGRLAGISAAQLVADGRARREDCWKMANFLGMSMARQSLFSIRHTNWPWQALSQSLAHSVDTFLLLD